MVGAERENFEDLELEKNYYKNSQIIITLISKIEYFRITFFSYHPTVCFTIANACLIPQIFAQLMLKICPTFQL